MPIPGPGTAISMTTIATEFGGSVPHSLSEYYRSGGLVPNNPVNAAIPTTGAISMGSFYGSANRTTVALTIASNSLNYNVYTNRSPTYVSGATDLTVTVNPGVTVGSASTPTYAMLVPSEFSPTDTVTIINNGVIQGMGGAGGAGAGPPALGGGAGAAGGNAIFVNRPTTITNNGTVAAGGGGGGGGGRGINPGSFVAPGGGGGGGAGTNGGAGGASGGPADVPTQSVAGSAGTSPAGGAGGAGAFGRPSKQGPFPGGPGGAGGGRGAAGTTGTTAPSNIQPPSSGGAGGARGNYIVGNPFVTWPVNGTRQGGVA